MATNDTLKNQLTEQKTQEVDAQSLGFKSLMATPTMKKKFQDILHEKSDSFMGSLMTLVGGDNYLVKAEPMTIIASALKAATMDLPIDKILVTHILFRLIEAKRKETSGLLTMRPSSYLGTKATFS